MNRKKIFFPIIIVIILISLFLYRYKGQQNIIFQGITMGTTYSVRLSQIEHNININKLKKEVDILLHKINKQMSVYDSESEISIFNNLKGTSPFPISAEFANVVKYALDIAESSNGAFDPTIAPLINLWGFGTKGIKETPPTQEAIQKLKSENNYKNIILNNNTLQKKNKILSLNLGAIAKGYGADYIVKFLKKNGFKNGFVEIGGEISVFGQKHNNTPWTIAIERPVYNHYTSRNLYKKLYLSEDCGIATSGDYRNFFKDKNKTYSHLIDPRTGYPINNNVASVTVIAKNCKEADALATTIMILGVNEGLKLIKKYPTAEVFIITRNNKNTFKEVFSKGFKTYLSK